MGKENLLSGLLTKATLMGFSKSAGPSSIRVPIKARWTPSNVVLEPPNEKGKVHGTVTGVLGLFLGRAKLGARVTMVLEETSRLVGGKKYYLAETDEGEYLMMFSENTSVEEVHMVGEYRRVTRPGRDSELSILISSIVGKQNPTKPFEKKIIATAKVLAQRAGSTRLEVRIEDSIWLVEALHMDVSAGYSVDIGNLNVLPRSLPITKDLLAILIQKLMDPRNFK